MHAAGVCYCNECKFVCIGENEAESWCYCKMTNRTLGEVREKIVISLSMLLSKSVNHLVIHAENFRNAVTSYELQDIGKTVFLTREAAEAALKEREAEHDR